MSIRQQGGVFGRNPSFNDVDVQGDLNVGGSFSINGEVLSGLDFEGTWNASTNTPDLTAITPSTGQFWIVSTAGTTDLDGITNWGVGDWALYDGTVWRRIEGGADGNFENLAYTGTLTGGTGIVNIGAGQVYKDASGNVGIGTSAPSQALHISRSVGGISIPLVLQNTAASVDGRGSRVQFRSSGTNMAAVEGLTEGDSTAGRLRFYTTPSGGSEQTRMVINSVGNVGIGVASPSEKLSVSGNVAITGSLSKGSGSFKIDHPLKPDTHHLVHSFIEGPKADNIYRGTVALVAGAATIDLDEVSGMTPGTFAALNRDVQCFTSNETGWTQVRGRVVGNMLTIEAQDADCADEVSWIVIGERQDATIVSANWTDENGRVIVEPEKVAAPDAVSEPDPSFTADELLMVQQEAGK